MRFTKWTGLGLLGLVGYWVVFWSIGLQTKWSVESGESSVLLSTLDTPLSTLHSDPPPPTYAETPQPVLTEWESAGTLRGDNSDALLTARLVELVDRRLESYQLEITAAITEAVALTSPLAQFDPSEVDACFEANLPVWERMIDQCLAKVVLEKMASHADVSIYVFEHDADEFPADAASGE